MSARGYCCGRNQQLFCDGVQHRIHNFCMGIHLGTGGICRLTRTAPGELSTSHDSVAAIVRGGHEFVGLETDDANEYQVKSPEGGRRGAHPETSDSDLRQYYHKWIAESPLEAAAFQ